MATDTTTVGHDSVVTPPENSLRPARRFQFGVFHVDVSNGELQKQGSKIKLQEKPFQLLVLLLEHAGRITTREELRQGLWSADTFVDFDANLKTTLNKLRQVLGDSAENPIYIETIPRQGYRFLPPVMSLECEPSFDGRRPNVGHLEIGRPTHKLFRNECRSAPCRVAAGQRGDVDACADWCRDLCASNEGRARSKTDAAACVAARAAF
jgi:DNA-binding winged helix-turn-helix (wHTH) protein